MAMNVFGTPITNATLKQMAEYERKEIITQRDRAVVALRTKNSDGKDMNARAYLEAMREASQKNAMLCLIYNATGDSVIVDAGAAYNRIIGSPYPLIIANGQWGAFSKIVAGQLDNSTSAIVYAAKNAESGQQCQILYLFEYSESGCRCCTEIKPSNYYPMRGGRLTLREEYGTLNNSSNVSRYHDLGFSSFASIGGNLKCCYFEGIMTLEGSWSFDHAT